MRRGAEAVDADALCVACHTPGPVADQSSTQQQSGLHIGMPRRQVKTVSTVRDCAFGVAAVDRVAGEARVVAEIFAQCETVAALSAGSPDPRHTDPIADRDSRKCYWQS